MKIRKKDLYNSKPNNLIRLANHLGLDIVGMKHRQIARLIYWRLTRVEAWRKRRLDF